MSMRILAIDHIVLTVRSLERACAFYEGVLGMTRKTFADGRTALHFGSQKINLHLSGREFEPKAARPEPGAADICLLVADVREAQAAIEAAGIDVIEGPVAKEGARGVLLSIYCRDPDGNLVELSEYR